MREFQVIHTHIQFMILISSQCKKIDPKYVILTWQKCMNQTLVLTQFLSGNSSVANLTSLFYFYTENKVGRYQVILEMVWGRHGSQCLGNVDLPYFLCGCNCPLRKRSRKRSSVTKTTELQALPNHYDP